MVPSDSGRDPFDFGRDPITSDFGRFRPISKRLRQISKRLRQISDGSVLSGVFTRFWTVHCLSEKGISFLVYSRIQAYR